MVGGMEKLSFALAKEFSKQVDTTLITWGRSQKYLPYFLPFVFLKSLYLIPKKKITNIHLGDALLSPLGLLLKTIFGIKTTVTACGLDVTFNFAPYQMIVPQCLKRMDKIICISNATLEECVKRGVPREKCVMIPCGVYPEEFKIKASRKDLEKIVGQNLLGKKVIITVGRLVERKGVYWFIKNVFPKLEKNTIYLVIGDGQDREKINNLVKKLGYEDRIFLLGKIPDKELKIIYNTADLFVMPNINIPGDIEGFGIVAIEAASTGLSVLASKYVGIDNVQKNQYMNILMNSHWSEEVNGIYRNSGIKKNKLKRWISKKYNWGTIIDQYLITLSNYDKQ